MIPYDDQFYRLCMANKDIAMERSPVGELIIMSPQPSQSAGIELKLKAKSKFNLPVWR